MPGRERGKGPVVIVTGALAPYTHVLYEGLADALDRPLHVLACSARETSRLWALETSDKYRFEVLSGLRWHRDTITNYYANPSVVSRIAALKPAVLVLNDFSPTMLMASLAAGLSGLPYGLRTDGVPETDPSRNSRLRRLLRQTLASRAAFGIGPSLGSKALLEHFGLKTPFASAPLFPAWCAPACQTDPAERPFDLLFCGTLNDEMKGARFFTEVAVGCVALGLTPKVRVVGTGPLHDEMAARFAEAGIAAQFDGFLQKEALPEAYGSAKTFLFPSRGDVWGIVVQEALQCGAVVVASPHSGAARELIEPNGCGLVLPLDQARWSAAIVALHRDAGCRARLRAAGEKALQAYTLEHAVAAYRSVLEPYLA